MAAQSINFHAPNFAIVSQRRVDPPFARIAPQEQPYTIAIASAPDALLEAAGFPRPLHPHMETLCDTSFAASLTGSKLEPNSALLRHRLNYRF